MNSTIRNILLIILAICGLAACKGQDEPTPEPEKGRRTVMVYMLANNTLGSAGYDTSDLQEMLEGVEAGALGEGGRLLVFHEVSYGAAPEMKEVTPAGIVTLKTYPGDISGVEASTMSMALDDMKALAPAASYGLVLWSHASGWIEDGLTEPALAPEVPRPLSFGIDGRKKMNITTLTSVLAGRGLDFVYFDCCYMMGVETVYELREAATVMAGSPTELPSAGMPYERTLPYFFAAGTADLEGAARATFEHYDAMTGSARTCTMSVIRTEALPRLARATRAIYAQAHAGMPMGFTPQRYTATSTGSCNYFDFAQYVRKLGEGSPELTAEFDAALAAAVSYEAATPYLWSTVPLEHHSGLSTYILPSRAQASDRGYNTLAWWADVASALGE